MSHRLHQRDAGVDGQANLLKDIRIVCVVGAIIGKNSCCAAHVHFVQLSQYRVSRAPIVMGTDVGVFGNSESQSIWVKGDVFKNSRNMETHGQ